MEEDILKLIQREKSEFEKEDIEIVEGLSFNQKNIIEKIYRLYNSKFAHGETDIDGDKKYFFNINRNPCKVTTKAIDFDTKDVRVMTAEGGDPLQTWFFERDLKFWMKDQNFGKVLNRIFAELPIFGSVVLKIIKGKPYFVDLRNFIVDTGADTLGKSNYIIEEHLYTPIEFRKVGKEVSWDKVDETLEDWRKMGQTYLTVYERYGEVETTDNKGGKHYEYKRIFLADVGIDQKLEGRTIPHGGIVLKEDSVNTHPYVEFHLEKMSGRWLGIGVVEVLFDPQVRQNELANLLAKGSYWASLRVFQTRDTTINRNFKTDVKQGEVLNPDDPITQVDMTDRNLAFFNEETQKWLANRDENTFSYDVIRGERLPAGTPLGSARLAAYMTSSHFDQIRENIALDVKEFLYNIIIPRFKTENSKEHMVRLVGQDLDKINTLLINSRATEEMIKFVAEKGKLPTDDHMEIVRAAIGELVKQGKEKLVTIPEGFYKDIKYKIEIDITGESKDNTVFAQDMLAALQAITADPTLLTDPSKKKFFFKWMEARGIPPIDFEPEIEIPSAKTLMETMPPRGAGGGVSRPVVPQAPSMAPMPQTL